MLWCEHLAVPRILYTAGQPGWVLGGRFIEIGLCYADPPIGAAAVCRDTADGCQPCVYGLVVLLAQMAGAPGELGFPEGVPA